MRFVSSKIVRHFFVRAVVCLLFDIKFQMKHSCCYGQSVLLCVCADAFFIAAGASFDIKWFRIFIIYEMFIPLWVQNHNNLDIYPYWHGHYLIEQLFNTLTITSPAILMYSDCGKPKRTTSDWMRTISFPEKCALFFTTFCLVNWNEMK